ncbi:MAG: nucleoid occlusion factor SlmA [Acidiferrobacterales bacterium]
MPRPSGSERKQEILQTLARLLEEIQGRHVTIAMLAREIGLSEAALYRHFPGKEQMFEGLIEFIEETVFTRVNRILSESSGADHKLQSILSLVLGFSDRNPGISRLMHGDVLVGESDQLRKRMTQFFNRLETQLKQVLREARLSDTTQQSATDSALLLMAYLEGRIAQFIRSGFNVSPLDGWDEHWQMLRSIIFR